MALVLSMAIILMLLYLAYILRTWALTESQKVFFRLQQESLPLSKLIKTQTTCPNCPEQLMMGNSVYPGEIEIIFTRCSSCTYNDLAVLRECNECKVALKLDNVRIRCEHGIWIKSSIT